MADRADGLKEALWPEFEYYQFQAMLELRSKFTGGFESYWDFLQAQVATDILLI